MSVFTSTKPAYRPKVHFTEYLASEEPEETKPAETPDDGAKPTEQEQSKLADLLLAA